MTEYYIGLMSGTSCDGVDAALVRIAGSRLETKLDLLDFRTFGYSRDLRERLLEFHPDLFLSIQGKLDPPTAQALRRHLPQLKMLFWWGDILTPTGRRKRR